MFRFLVNFTKVIAIACIIGVSLRIIDIIFLKEKTKDVATTNTISETQNEEILEVANESNNIEEQTTNETKQEVIETKSEEKYTEVEVEIAEKKECKNNNHGMSVGNSGKWFNTKEEAIATYKQESKMWGDKWKNNEISDDEYYRNCPYGYEIWSCMYCGKWTINYYYDN